MSNDSYLRAFYHHDDVLQRQLQYVVETDELPEDLRTAFVYGMPFVFSGWVVKLKRLAFVKFWRSFIVY